MMYLRKNYSNNFTFTGAELSTITGNSIYYLIHLVSDDNFQNEILFTGEDISSNIVRYNQFQIIETGSTYVNLTASTIHLSTPGYYNYSIYQMTGQTNLDLSGCTGSPLEYGKCYFSGATVDLVEYNYSGNSQIFVYNN